MVAEMYQCVFSTERRVDMKPGRAQLTGEQRDGILAVIDQ